MNNLVVSISQRILKPLSSYRPLGGTSNGIVKDIEDIQLEPDEAVLGVYENTPGRINDAIVVTTLGLHLRTDTNWRFLAYNQIEAIETPANKQAVAGLTLHLGNDGSVWVPVVGGRGKFRDVFEFLRFLQRVRSLQDMPSTSMAVGLR